MLSLHHLTRTTPLRFLVSSCRVPAGPPWRMCLHGHQGNPEVSKDRNAPPSHFRGLGAPCLPHHCHLLLLGHQACSSPHPQCCPNVEASCFRTSALPCRGCVGLGEPSPQIQPLTSYQERPLPCTRLARTRTSWAQQLQALRCRMEATGLHRASGVPPQAPTTLHTSVFAEWSLLLGPQLHWVTLHRKACSRPESTGGFPCRKAPWL